jgi:hypothetical protein
VQQLQLSSTGLGAASAVAETQAGQSQLDQVRCDKGRVERSEGWELLPACGLL